ncbi:hypothetical protein CHS0354_034927 [Potamilus streckersoni]|uniref:Uncharacterized protein n=1 Tax=Potamilus streckersoni TaxID=2493646 RepID=A0AAE0SD86_9BIVA|nr:hypothetical protein CHS0354_034927 [Potamilus streckersoni]
MVTLAKRRGARRNLSSNMINNIVCKNVVPTGLTITTQPSNKRPLQNADVYIDFDHERNGQPKDGMNQFYFEPDIIADKPWILPWSSESRYKKTDKYKRVTLTPYDINAAKRWSLSQAGVDGFVGIDDLHRVLLHCSFGKGASGSPGFWIRPNNGQSYVVLMLVRGYPDWYYDDKHPAATKAGFPLNHLVEQGVSMESIYNDMKNNAPGLWEDIFCCV